jgi:hypothetical protein
MNESTYMEKKWTPYLSLEFMSPSKRIWLQKIERKAQKLLSKYKPGFSTELKHHLTAYPSKPPYLYGLQKIHKKSIPLSNSELHWFTLLCTGGFSAEDFESSGWSQIVFCQEFKTLYSNTVKYLGTRNRHLGKFQCSQPLYQCPCQWSITSHPE